MSRKNGRKGLRQLYKCRSCGRQFIGGNRLKSEYIDGSKPYPSWLRSTE